MISLFKTIFENSFTGFVLLGKNSEIIHANEAFCSMAGYDKKQICAIKFSQLLMQDCKDRFEETVRRLSNQEMDHIIEVCRKMDFESETYWQNDLHRLYDEESGKRFIFGIIEDITERKKGHDQLISAKDAAEKSTRDKSDFLANMSHEIRTPIHTIIGMNEMLSETALDPEQGEYAEQVRFAAEVLLGLINDILDVSKIEAGKLDLEAIEFDLYKMTEDAINMLSLEAHKKELEVLLDIQQGVPKKVIGDPVRLRQILVNLFNNAIKFTKEGKIKTSIEFIEALDDSILLKFTIEDTGIGIPKDKLGKLFKAFSQVDSSTTRKFGGTGLGLTISQNLSRLMNGSIGVESDYGKGSAFWFTALLGGVEQDEVCPPVADDLKGVKVLVVDNHADARHLLLRFLREWGYDGHEAPGGQEALEMLKAHSAEGAPFQVCLVDLFMPGMDGWQLASEINADKDINYTKLILFSPAGKSGEEAKMKLLHWFDAYMSKPVKKIELYSGLERILADEVDLESVDEAEEVEELEEISNAGGAAVNFISAKILIAEDHEVNQYLFKTILESLNHTVSVANNGLEAVEAAKNETFDAIFMDVQMPEMNGYEATEKIRSLGISTPIIAATASAVKEEREKCSAVGMDDLLIKPFKKADVIPLLRKWLPKQEEAEEEEEEETEIEIVEAEGAGYYPAPHAESDRADEEYEPEPAGSASAASVGSFVPDTEIFNLEQATEAFMGKEDIVKKVLRSFVDKVEGQIPVMEEALKNSDLETLRGEAHSIKGGGLNLSVIRLGNKGKDLEDASREGRAEDAARYFDELKSLYAELTENVQPLFRE